MIQLSPVRTRALAAIALAGALTMLAPGVVAADSEHGQHGNYIFTDGSETTTGATCIYSETNNRLDTIVVKPPKVWWPQTNADNHHQHGKVGWRVIVRTSATPVTGPFEVAYTSPIQKATAYEDQDSPYDDATKAPLTKRTIDWHAGQHGNVDVQVIVQAYWFKGDGSVKGWVKHPVVWYLYKLGASQGTFTNWCHNFGIAG